MFKIAALAPNRIFTALIIICLLTLCTSCNTSGTEGPVWVGDPIMSSGLDANGDPIDSVTKFDPAPKIVYCYLSIKGPVGFKMFVRWFYEGNLVREEFIDFGEVRKSSANLTVNDGNPLPQGTYRCDYTYGGEEAARSIEFTVAATNE